VTLLIVAFFTGIVLGLYYQFLVLIPIALAAALTSSVVAFFSGDSVLYALYAIIVPAIALQSGYIAGLTGRDFLASRLARSDLQSKRV
jgi:hypothetical protein